jgi:hypothetical protein
MPPLVASVLPPSLVMLLLQFLEVDTAPPAAFEPPFAAAPPMPLSEASSMAPSQAIVSRTTPTQPRLIGRLRFARGGYIEFVIVAPLMLQVWL